MTTWEQIVGGGSTPNPFTVVNTTTDGYSANYGEFVITDQSSVSLPAPSQNEIVAIRAFDQSVTISTPSGSIWDYGSSATYQDTVPAIFVSDGTDWYLRSPEDLGV